MTDSKVKSDAKVRKFWLIAGMINLVFVFMLSSGSLLFGLFEKELVKQPEVRTFVSSVFGGFAFAFAFFFGIFVFLYNRSYKKFGTGVLTVLVICGVIQLPNQYTQLKQFHRLALQITSGIPQMTTYIRAIEIAMIVMMITGLFWTLMCMALKEKNLQRRAEILESDKQFAKGSKAIKEAPGLKELKQGYQELKGQYAKEGWYLKRLYRKRKAELR